MGKLGLILLASISLSITPQTSSNVGEENTNNETRVTVSRRISFDVFTLHGNNTDVLKSKSCIRGSNQTYLVVENKCINNEDLLNGNSSNLYMCNHLGHTKLCIMYVCYHMLGK